MQIIDKTDFRNNSPERLHSLFLEHGFSSQSIQNFKKAFRTQDVSDLAELSGVRNLAPILRFLPFRTLKEDARVEDSEGNEKYVFETEDHALVESVLMPSKREVSLCISVQAGCRFGCRFCRTGKSGLRRSLMPYEMLEQVRQIYLHSISPKRLSCITFMGMGEPFDNLENCRIAFDWMRTDWGFHVGAKKITFSTIGALNWEGFFDFTSLPNLAVSLHSANEEKRRWLMPRAGTTLARLKEHMIHYTARTNKQISVEYCLFSGLNDTRDDALELSDYLQGIPCKINLLNFNPVEMKCFQPVTEAKILEFKSWLKHRGFSVIYRKSLGKEISAGCGQLGGSIIQPERNHEK